MPRHTRSPRAPLRQRVTWEDATCGELEILSDPFRQTRAHCLCCGTRGLWMAEGGADDDDPEILVCTHCRTLIYLNGQPQPTSGFWATIVRQLQLAEARRHR